MALWLQCRKMGSYSFFFIALFGICSGTGSDSNLTCTKPHEVPDCLFGCPPERTCRNYKYALPCAPPPPHDPCKPQCVCADGYARNLDGICITIEQCEQCAGNNEHFTCNGPYDEHCAGACVCDDGYQRNANACVSTTATPPPVIASPPPPPTGSANPPSTGPVNPPSTGPVNPPSTGPVNPPSTGPVNPPSTGPVNPPSTGPVDPPTGHCGDDSPPIQPVQAGSQVVVYWEGKVTSGQ